METLLIPAREGRGFHVSTGQKFRVVTPKGQQAADFFAYNAKNVGEWLSPNHTWVWNRNVHPRVGDPLLSRFRRTMLELVADTAEGVHDMMIPACDQLRYEQLGFEGPHPNCSDNLCTAMRRLGYNIDVIPQPINLFTHTVVETDGAFNSPPNPVKPGAFVELLARMDLICVVSACPYDLFIEGWPINSPDKGPTEIVVEIL